MPPFRSLMARYSSETGLASDLKSERYLWTDAFAVCNYLGAYQTENKREDLDRATNLVDQVHNILGKYRSDDDREGWLGSEEHPTAAGLRIGKPEPERHQDAPLNYQAEWQKDGQYFHYLTKWMHALRQMYKVTNQDCYIQFAGDLADASMKFVHGGDGMYWKMSTDLSYPLVKEMGKHDPLDGYITLLELQETTKKLDLTKNIENLRNLITKVDLRTTDSLGLGGLLFDAYRLYQLDSDPELFEEILSGVKWGLRNYESMSHLAFRELGLAIGIKAAQKMDVLESHHHLYEEITTYWLDRSDFEEHRQINTVMLATSLQPDGFLELN